MQDGKVCYYKTTLNDSSVSKPKYIGEVTSRSNVTCDAYWAMYVRED